MSANGLILKRCVCAAALIAASGRVAAQDVPSAPGLHRDVVFSEYAAPSENREILRRMLTPLAFAQMEKVVARSGKSLQTLPLDLKDERFTVYVPTSPPPPAGYGLLVFVPPWDDARLPDGWSSILDARGIVFVTAARSGNEQGVVNRRAPLALLAEENTVRRYRIDPARIYVGGFSGGSRVAMRLALAYPDIFTGAFLNAGADPIGDASAPLPPDDLFSRFQQSSRLYYATGALDLSTLGMDARSLHAMRDLCVFNTQSARTPRTGHDIADAHVLFAALDFLAAPPATDDERLAACRKNLEADLQQALQDIRAALAQGRKNDARKMLLDANNRFGGLAANDLIALAEQLNLDAMVQPQSR
jgi:pimeloyl-ACP methyl ester carboxylesterase